MNKKVENFWVQSKAAYSLLEKLERGIKMGRMSETYLLVSANYLLTMWLAEKLEGGNHPTSEQMRSAYRGFLRELGADEEKLNP